MEAPTPNHGRSRSEMMSSSYLFTLASPTTIIVVKAKGGKNLPTIPSGK